MDAMGWISKGKSWDPLLLSVSPNKKNDDSTRVAGDVETCKVLHLLNCKLHGGRLENLSLGLMAKIQH